MRYVCLLLVSLSVMLPLTAAAEEPLAFGPALRTSWRSLPFRWFLVANLNKEFVYSMLTASVPFWAKYVLEIRAPVVRLLLRRGRDHTIQRSHAFKSGACVHSQTGLPRMGEAGSSG